MMTYTKIKPGTHDRGPRSFEERLREKIDTSPGQGPRGDCHEWRGATNGEAGYGIVVRDGRRVLAHRAVYELHEGPLPRWTRRGDPVVRHTCDNPPCCRREHLRVGSDLENMRDMVARRRSPRGERHGANKLTEADVWAIRSALADGDTLEVIARRHGVSFQAVSKVKTGKTWGWLA